jgi:dTDP-4-amino-4,6-dideoxygalactose transaminase
VPVPFIHLGLQHKSIRKEVLTALTKIADSQKFVLGEHGLALEKKIAAYCGVAHAVGLASGSDALFLSLLALDIGAGDEVITTPFTFFASAGSITRTGAKVVFCDVDPDTCNIDPAKIASVITTRTKAILPVHLFGLPCDMDAIMRIARKHKLAVIEDAAQSFGSTYKGKPSGVVGDAGCFSFYPTKNLGGAGDGGMVVTRSKKIADKIRLLRNHGSRVKYHHEFAGINSRLDEIQAAWVGIKMKHIDQWNDARRRHAKVYDEAFKELPIKTPTRSKDSLSNYHLYSIQTDRRDQLASYLHDKGIGCGVYYPLSLHLQPCYKELAYRKGDLPVSESLSKTILSLPMYAEMTASQRTEVIKAVRSFFN